MAWLLRGSGGPSAPPLSHPPRGGSAGRLSPHLTHVDGLVPPAQAPRLPRSPLLGPERPVWGFKGAPKQQGPSCHRGDSPHPRAQDPSWAPWSPVAPINSFQLGPHLSPLPSPRVLREGLGWAWFSGRPLPHCPPRCPPPSPFVPGNLTAVPMAGCEGALWTSGELGAS